jgi:ligand-binding SRPBCC domain-containing protein
MAHFTLTKKIDAPTGAVFGLFADFAHTPGRIKAITKLEIVTPGPVGVGTRFKETRVMFGKDHTEEMQITAFNPGHSYEITCQSCGAEYRTVFRFTPDGDGTRVDVDFQTRATSAWVKVMAPLGWLMGGMVKKCVNQDVEDLKKVAESVPVG